MRRNGNANKPNADTDQDVAVGAAGRGVDCDCDRMEDSVEFIANLIRHGDARGHTAIEAPRPDVAEDRYNDSVREVADATLFPTAVIW